MGGLSTFGRFVDGAFEVISSPGLLIIGIRYLIVTIIVGFLAVIAVLYLESCVRPGTE